MALGSPVTKGAQGVLPLKKFSPLLKKMWLT